MVSTWVGKHLDQQSQRSAILDEGGDILNLNELSIWVVNIRINKSLRLAIWEEAGDILDTTHLICLCHISEYMGDRPSEFEIFHLDRGR